MKVDCYFADTIATQLDLESEPKSMKKCKKRPDWSKWREAIAIELNSLKKRDVFGNVNLTPKGIYPVGHK